jgi:hypothetical protein
MKPPLVLSSTLLGALTLCLAATPAAAQETAPPPSAMAPPPNSAPVTSIGQGGIGVGAVEWLSPFVTGGEFVYDQSMFHIEAVLGFGHTSNADNTSSSTFDIGVAGWYHLARGTNADFSIGGGAGLFYNAPVGAGASSTQFALEPGIEARAFLTPNFALTFRAGFAITFGDNQSPTTISLGGQGSGQFGFVYFFR